MNNTMEYKGYHTKIKFYSESMTLRGKIEGINDYVDFEASDISSVEAEFHAAVDDYLEFCKEVGKKPEKEYKGTFNVRISPELHRKIALCALKEDCSLNSAVENAIREFVNNHSYRSQTLSESKDVTMKTIRMDSLEYKNVSPLQVDNVLPFVKGEDSAYKMG